MSRDALRLAAEDTADLQIISSAVQDAVGKIGALRYQARQRRFSFELNRFRWELQPNAGGQPERVRSLLGFDGVLGVKARGLTKADPDMIISLLSIAFEPADEPPGGIIRLTFAGDGELEIAVECIDVALLDGVNAWPTRHTPSHEPRRR